MPMDVQDSINEINLSLQRITITQEALTKDVAKHIRRTDRLDDHVTMLEKMHNNCPARVNAQASKTVMAWIKDLSVIVGLVVLLLKTFSII